MRQANHQTVKIFSAGTIVSLLLSALFFWIWYEQYLRWDFNELGRYYDASTGIVYTDAGFVWCIPAIAFLILAVGIILFRLIKKRAFGKATH